MFIKQSKQKNNMFKTKHIELNSRKCVACYKCIEVCLKKVISKIDLVVHKHAIFKKSYDCIGCGMCLKVCQPGALSKV
jgi:NAD-dependent dihydropyrimidine dehydrogenase PreA subunit